MQSCHIHPHCILLQSIAASIAFSISSCFIPRCASHSLISPAGTITRAVILPFKFGTPRELSGNHLHHCHKNVRYTCRMLVTILHRQHKEFQNNPFGTGRCFRQRSLLEKATDRLAPSPSLNCRGYRDTGTRGAC